MADEALIGSASRLSERDDRDDGDSQLSGCGYDADASLDASLRRRKQRSPRSRRRQALGACMQSMKGQVAFLQHLVRRHAEKASSAASCERDCAGDLSALSFSSLSPVHGAGIDATMLSNANTAKRLLFQEDTWELDSEPGRTRNSSSAESAAVARAAELERENAALKEQVVREGERSNETVTELLDEIEVLKRAACAREQENARLRAALQRLTKQSREQSPEPVGVEVSAVVSMSDHTESENQVEDQASTIVTVHEDEAAAKEPQIAAANPADEQLEKSSTAVHVGHERCQVKIHELWQTIKNLKVYVETYRIESVDLKVQRDEAVASAERAWKDNARLAGNANPQAKIKYLQAVKDENAVLAKKIRELQSRLAAHQAKRAAKRSAVVDPRESSQSDLSESLDESALEPLALPLEAPECDSSAGDSEPERSRLFRKMWQHNKELEAEIARLRDQKRELATRRGRSGSATSSASTSSVPSSGAAGKWVAVTTRSSNNSRHRRHLPSVA